MCTQQDIILWWLEQQQCHPCAQDVIYIRPCLLSFLLTLHPFAPSCIILFPSTLFCHSFSMVPPNLSPCFKLSFSRLHPENLKATATHIHFSLILYLHCTFNSRLRHRAAVQQSSMSKHWQRQRQKQWQRKLPETTWGRNLGSKWSRSSSGWRRIVWLWVITLPRMYTTESNSTTQGDGRILSMRIRICESTLAYSI